MMFSDSDFKVGGGGGGGGGGAPVPIFTPKNPFHFLLILSTIPLKRKGTPTLAKGDVQFGYIISRIFSLLDPSLSELPRPQSPARK